MRLEWLAQLARRDAADAQAAQAEAIELPSPAEGGRTVGNFQNPSVILKELRPVLAADYVTIRRALDALAVKAKAKRDEAETYWAEVVRRIVT